MELGLDRAAMPPSSSVGIARAASFPSPARETGESVCLSLVVCGIKRVSKCRVEVSRVLKNEKGIVSFAMPQPAVPLPST